jgi:hypothetical protein
MQKACQFRVIASGQGMLVAALLVERSIQNPVQRILYSPVKNMWTSSFNLLTSKKESLRLKLKIICLAFF